MGIENAAGGVTEGGRSPTGGTSASGGARFTPGELRLAVPGGLDKHVIILSKEGSTLPRPPHQRPPDEAVHEFP